jgi:hypothetical protein
LSFPGTTVPFGPCLPTKSSSHKINTKKNKYKNNNTWKSFPVTSPLILNSGKNKASTKGTGQAVLAASRGSLRVV